MSYILTIDQKPAYLHAIVTGWNSRENVERYLEEIRRECAVRSCFKVLVEERLAGPRLAMKDVFEIVAEGSRAASKAFQAFAYVDVNARGDLMQFAETVAINRGMPVRIFPTVPEAEKWLLTEERGGAGS